MVDVWDWTDFSCVLASTTIALVVTVWLWRKGWLHHGVRAKENSTKKQCPAKTKSVVQLDSLEAIREVLLRGDQTFQRISLHDGVLTDSEIEAWQREKVTCLRTYLQEITSKKREFFESTLTSCAKDLIRLMETTYSEPKQFPELLSSCILNFTFRITLGESCDSDPLLETQVKTVVEQWPSYENIASSAFEGSLKENYGEFIAAKEKLENLLKEHIANRKKICDSENQDSYLDYYLANNEEDKDYSVLSKHLMGFFLCCNKALSKCLISALEAIIDNPDVQEKMQAELADVAVQENLLTLWLQNRKRVPFSDAVLKEVLRLSTPVPRIMGLSHSAAPEADGAEEKVLSANLKAVLQDPKLWKKSNEFMPSQFFDDGTEDAFIPFALGESSCPGQDFFMVTSFVILARILLKFQLKRHERPAKTDGGNNSTSDPNPSLFVTERSEKQA